MSELEDTILSRSIDWHVGTLVEVHMDIGRTVLRVHSRGEFPEVDMIETPLGPADGPLVKFLGATVIKRGSLVQEDVIPGVIIGSFGMVFEVNNRPYLSDGTAQSVAVRRGRIPKNKQFRTVARG